MPGLVYYSSTSENTHRFIEKLGLPAQRLPQMTADDTLMVDEPFVLVTPTYGGDGDKNAVPKQVKKFLNVPSNRSLIRGVIGAGNTNFGEEFCRAGDIIASKCNVPHLYKFELMGTPEDVDRVIKGLEEFWS